MNIFRCLSIGLIGLLPSQGWSADNTPFYVGGYAQASITDAADITRDPAQATPLSSDTDSFGLNGGPGLWAGYHFKSLPVSLEASTSWRVRHDLNVLFFEVAGPPWPSSSKSNLSTVDMMFSVLWDIPVKKWKMKPYIGGGGGAVYYQTDTQLRSTGAMNDAPNTSGVNPAWQVQTGFRYPIGKKWDARVDYRYMDLGTIETGRLTTGDSFEVDMTSHDLRLGVAYNF